MTAKLGVRRVLALLGVAVLGVGAWVVARADLGAERARAALIEALGARLGAQAGAQPGFEVELQRVELSLSERRLRAEGVKVRGAWGSVAARELTAELSWLELAQGEMAPERFELRGAEVELDLRGASPARGASSALPALRLRDSAVTVRLEHGVATLGGVRLDLDGDRVALTAERGSYTARDRATTLGRVELTGRRQAQGLVFDSGTLVLGDARVALAALELPHPLGQSARGRLRADGALGPLLALGLGLPVEGASLPLDGRALITGTFALGPRGRSFALDAALDAPRFAGQALAARASLQLVQAEGARGVSLRAQLEQAQGDAGGAAAGVRQVEATLEPSHKGLVASSLQLGLGGSTLLGSAELSGARLSAQLVSEDAAIADVAALFAAAHAGHAGQGALSGRGKVELRVEGTPAEPVLALRAELRQGALLGASFERATLAVRSGSEARGLVIEELALHSGRSRVLADDLVVEERADGRTRARGGLRVEKLPLAELWRVLGTPEGATPSLLQGEADGRIALSHDERGATRAALDLTLRAASLHGLRFATGVLAATLGDDGRVELDSLALREAGSSLSFTGTLGGAGPLDVRGKLERLSLGQLVAGAPGWLGLSGEATGNATFSGKASAPEARVEVSVDQLSLLGVALGTQALRAELAPTSATERRCDADSAPLDLASLRKSGAERAWLLCGGSQGARASLALGVSAELPLRGKLGVERADLAALFAARGADGGKPMPARASFAVDVTGGGLRAPGSLSFALAVRELSVGEGKHVLTARAPFELRSQRGALSLEGGELTADHTRLRLGVEGALPHGKLTAKGTIAAAALLAAAPVPLVTDAFGEVAIDAALPLDGAPAHFRLQPLDAIVHLGTGIVARKLRGSIALEPEGLRLEDITAQVGGGTLRASGTLRAALRPGGAVLDRYDLTLSAQDVVIEPAQRFTLGFDADVRLRSQKTAGPPTLSGRVRVERFVYGRHIQLPEALIAMNQADRRERARYDPARDRVAFELELEQAAPLLVRNRMIDAELRVLGEARTLRVVGTNQRFGLLGGMEVERGRVLFHGDEFEIARGAVRFGDETRVAPVFELRAVAHKRSRKDASIVLEAKGDREAFSLDVHCDAGAARVLAEPFACEFARDQLRCDRFEQLATLWSCPVRTELSHAGPRERSEPRAGVGP